MCRWKKERSFVDKRTRQLLQDLGVRRDEGSQLAQNAQWAGSIAIAIGGMLLLAAVATLVLMCLRWLSAGAWPDWTPVALGYNAPVTALLGLNKVLAWLYRQALPELSFYAGVLGLWLGVGLNRR